MAIAAVIVLLLVLKRLLIHTRFEYQWSNIDIRGTLFDLIKGPCGKRKFA